MINTVEVAQRMLLSGNRITKFDFLTACNSVCLAQRIKDIRQMGWNVCSGSVKGKGTLKEYWLMPDEIERIRCLL